MAHPSHSTSRTVDWHTQVPLICRDTSPSHLFHSPRNVNSVSLSTITYQSILQHLLHLPLHHCLSSHLLSAQTSCDSKERSKYWSIIARSVETCVELMVPCTVLVATELAMTPSAVC